MGSLLCAAIIPIWVMTETELNGLLRRQVLHLLTWSLIISVMILHKKKALKVVLKAFLQIDNCNYFNTVTEPL
jgi:hypothetical protein